ncbi:MAG: trypsin-like serine protease [Cyanobacteria bacterium J06598_3]
MPFHSVANAITLHPDANPDDYLMDSADAPAVFALPNAEGEKDCSATLIDERWAVTAAYCVVTLYVADYETVPYQVEIDGMENVVEQVVVPDELIDGEIKVSRDAKGALTGLTFELVEADYEIALLGLASAVSHVTPVELYDADDEAGKTVTILGWETAEVEGSAVSNTAMDDPLRVADNRITQTDGNYFSVVFDAPGSDEALPLEGVGGSDDIGSPAFIETAEGTRLVGVSVIGSVVGSLDEEQPIDFSGIRALMSNNTDYGSQHDYLRMSQMKNWIRDVIASNSAI